MRFVEHPKHLLESNYNFTHQNALRFSRPMVPTHENSLLIAGA